MKATRDEQSTLEAIVISCNLLAVRLWNLKTRKRLALLQTLAILIAVFQYGMGTAGQHEEEIQTGFYTLFSTPI